MSFVAFKLYVGHRCVVLYAVQRLSTSTASDLCTLLLLTVCMRTVCVDAEQKNAKLNNWTWLNGLLTIGEHQNFLEEGKSIVGGASVACVVSYRCPIVTAFGIMQEYCRRLLVLPDTSTYIAFSRTCIASLEANNRRLLLRILQHIPKY